MKKKSSRPGAPARRDKSRRSSAGARAGTTWSPAALLAALVALVVARTLVPEDSGGQQGHGAPFVMLGLLLLAAWLLVQLRRGTLQFSWAWPDAAMLALVAWHTASAIFAFVVGAPRPALNMLWDWVAMGLVYFVARQLVRSQRAIRAVMVVMVGLACGLSLMAFHQTLVILPETRAAYETLQDSTEALYQETGQWMPPDSNMRQQFEARLASSLATATFALSNSLAGFLVPWLVVLGGIVFASLEPSPVPSLQGRGSFSGRRLAVVAGLLLLAVLAGCIVITGSRSAGIATLLGLAIVSLPCWRSAVWPRPWLRWCGAVLLIFAMVAAASVAATSPGRATLAAAERSMMFRVEYWRSTAAMIADHPWFGCGPGQFQDIYAAYKLPWAAEEVHDPHNGLLEVWATAGTPAAVALLLLLGLIAVGVIRRGNQPTDIDEPAPAVREEEASGAPALLGGLIGLGLGALLAWWSGFALLPSQVMLLAVGMLSAWWMLGSWNREGPLPRWLPLASAGALLVNLFVAGGIGFPSVADSLWLLLAVQLNLTELHNGPAASVAHKLDSPRTRLVGWAACLVLAGVLLAALWTEYLPVMGCRWRMNLADASLAAGLPNEYRAALDEAAAADPWSAPVAQQQAALRFAGYQALPTATQLRSFTESMDRALRLVPRRSGAWAQSAEYFAAIYQQSGNVEDLNEAAACWKRAIELYPTHAELYGQLARLWVSAGRTNEAMAVAAEALRLDDQKRAAGHENKLLSPALRDELDLLVKKPSGPAGDP